MFRKIGLAYKLRGNLQFNEFLSNGDAKGDDRAVPAGLDHGLPVHRELPRYPVRHRRTGACGSSDLLQQPGSTRRRCRRAIEHNIEDANKAYQHAEDILVRDLPGTPSFTAWTRPSGASGCPTCTTTSRNDVILERDRRRQGGVIRWPATSFVACCSCHSGLDRCLAADLRHGVRAARRSGRALAGDRPLSPAVQQQIRQLQPRRPVRRPIRQIHLGPAASATSARTAPGRPVSDHQPATPGDR